MWRWKMEDASDTSKHPGGDSFEYISLFIGVVVNVLFPVVPASTLIYEVHASECCGGIGKHFWRGENTSDSTKEKKKKKLKINVNKK